MTSNALLRISRLQSVGMAHTFIRLYHPIWQPLLPLSPLSLPRLIVQSKAICLSVDYFASHNCNCNYQLVHLRLPLVAYDVGRTSPGPDLTCLDI